MINGLGLLKGALVALAMVGIVFPQTRILASEQKLLSKPIVRMMASNSILDIRLAKDGTFTGRTVDQTGSPVEGAKVIVKQGTKVIAETMTDENGNFAVSKMKSGVYQVGSGATEGSYRIWTDQTAPPSAKPHSLLVMGENGTRGQWGGYDGYEFFIVAVAIGAAAAAIVAIAIAANAEREARHANQTTGTSGGILPVSP